MATTDFEDWIDSNVDINDINNVWAAYQTVLSANDYYPFEKTKKGQATYLKNSTKDATLALVTENAVTAFINMLEYPYSSQGGIEAAKAVNNHMEND
ncbi:hypothetical protein [Pedobacter sp. D749]|uniref:hypothetical protein n=1 Tax=Pedobacter sp. D749 TaxID=2856523 RepID=UPI001C5A053A|nr:hypothetical protein [Pedobacter sp. D749]QXU41456.1 hypothetical protein KYH19_21030 [Pedobacter sp. D749]